MVNAPLSRNFNSLRVSLTGECNLACTYCVPEKRCIKDPVYELSVDELIRVISWLNSILNLKKIRLTGGEPLISPKFDDTLSEISQMNFKDVSITTNGQILRSKIPIIKKFDIKRINVSLDTLSPIKFNKNTRGGELSKTLDGIDAALNQNIAVKINMVPVRNVNEDEILTVLDYCLDKGIELRYIELMQMGHLSDRKVFEEKLIPLSEIFEQINRKYQFSLIATPINSTSKRYQIKNRGTFGVIANDSDPCCTYCDRLRLTSTGNIHGCLSSNQSFSILQLLNHPEKKAIDELKVILTLAMKTKRKFSFEGSSTLMKQVGG